MEDFTKKIYGVPSKKYLKLEKICLKHILHLFPLLGGVNWHGGALNLASLL